jgi:hypothetical protein
MCKMYDIAMAAGNKRMKGNIFLGREMEILRQYEQSEFSERMLLFIQFPDLRSIFQEIEFKESAAQRTYTFSNKTKDSNQTVMSRQGRDTTKYENRSGRKGVEHGENDRSLRN